MPEVRAATESRREGPTTRGSHEVCRYGVPHTGGLGAPTMCTESLSEHRMSCSARMPPGRRRCPAGSRCGRHLGTVAPGCVELFAAGVGRRRA